MKIKFMGAAQTVTGSCFILEAAGRRVAVDCGMHQGSREVERRNEETRAYRPRELDAIFMTHAHIDHSGLLPRIVQAGFRGPVYVTPPTRDLVEILLLDSAHIQEMEALWKNRKRRRHGEEAVAPLYTQADAARAIPLLQTVPYGRSFSPFPGLRVCFQDAGHILGAAMIELWVDEGGRETKWVFSGDIGRPAQLLMREPTVIERADVLLLESTYGNRDHRGEEDSLNELAEAVAYCRRHGEKVIIPAFAVERTQEVLYCLHLLGRSGRLPADMPIFLDSPLAIRATEIFRRHADSLDEETRQRLAQGEDPLSLKQLQVTPGTRESMAINDAAGPAVVISASGMANAGRIKHHLRHNLWRPGCAVVFVGFQAQGTVGRQIVDGARTVRLFGEEIAVKARVFTINGFSAHAGQTQLLDWLGHFRPPLPKIFLVHGEPLAQQALAERIEQRFGIRVLRPAYLEEVVLEGDREPREVTFPDQATPPVDWPQVLAGLEEKARRLREGQSRLERLAWESQTDLRDQVLAADRALAAIMAALANLGGPPPEKRP